MTHFTESEIRRWSRSGPGADRARLVEHLAGCARCASAYAEAIRAQSFSPDAAAQPESGDVADFVRTGYDVPAKSASVVPFARSWRRAIIGLAAAAALIAAISVPFMMRREPDSRQDVTVRGGGLWALAPVGSVASGSEFEWAADFTPAAGYRLTIGDATGVVYTERTKQTRTRLTPEGWSRLTPGVDYWWSVTALDAADRIITVSARQAFTIRPRS